ncbi:MAG: hypothetical protein NZR01_06315 [Bryobacteraceae bacterium]|nr:hypothetical protein [Bryobacteraceae bacterium]
MGLPAHAITISIYAAAPGVVSSPATGGTAYNESFNSTSAWPTGLRTSPVTRPIGTFQLSPTSALQIQASDQYGGAGGSRYAAFGAQSGTAGAITLNLSNPTTFFGLWWSAIDPNNGISLYNGSNLLLRFSGADLISLFAVPTLTAQSGTAYATSSYRGKPGTSPLQNAGEYYVYTMFRISGLTFTRVVFDNSGSTASGFEMDNLQIRTGNFSIPTSSVLLRTYSMTPVPEPAFWMPAGAALGWLAWRRRRRNGRSGQDAA